MSIDTCENIIKAAEKLFADQGFSETTVRQITASADVNLAAINYHFGSKQGLIQAVAKKFLTPLSETLDRFISERALTSQQSVSLEESLDMLMRALLLVNSKNRSALPIFMRLLELAYMRNQGELRTYFMDQYGATFLRFIELVRGDSAPMEADEFFWRLHFLLGSITFTLSNLHTISAIEKKSTPGEAEVERVLHRMIPVLSAGMNARADKLFFCRL